MISRIITRLAPPTVALALIALIPAAVLLGRLGLLTDPIVLALFAVALSYLAAGLLITLRRVGNPIGWLLLWSGVLAGLTPLAAAYGMYGLQRAGSLPAASVLLWASSWLWLAGPATSPLTHVLFPMAGCCLPVGRG